MKEVEEWLGSGFESFKAAWITAKQKFAGRKAILEKLQTVIQANRMTAIKLHESAVAFLEQVSFPS